MLTEKGTLPIGIEYDGKLHRDFQIRESRMGDMIDITEDPVIAERAQKNSAFLSLVLLSKQVLRIGEMPNEKITPERLLEMHIADYNELQAAATRLALKRSSFRGADKAPQKDDNSPDENRV